MHGYALVKHIRQVSDNILQIEEGSLYPALLRMLKEGLLEYEAGVSAKGRPTRKYRLTKSGRRRLEHEDLRDLYGFRDSLAVLGFSATY